MASLKPCRTRTGHSQRDTAQGGIRIWPRWWQVIPVVGLFAIGSQPGSIAQGPEREHAVRLPDGKTVLETGWQWVLAADARCLYVVPETWPVSRDGLHAVAPDASVTLQLVFTRDAWLAHRARIRSAMQPAVVHDDSRERLWMEQTDGHRARHHVSVTDGACVCAAEITVIGPSAGDAVQRIASSVRVATDADRNWMMR